MIETAAAPYRQDRAPWGWRDMGAVLVLTAIALSLIFTVLALVISALGIDGDVESDPAGLAILLIGQALLDAAAVGIAAGFSLGKYGLSPAAWGLVRPPKLDVWWILGGLLLCYVGLSIYGIITTVLGIEWLEPQDNVPTEFFDHAAVVPLAVFLILIVAPLAEEMFFRGFLFHGLWGRIGFWPAAIGSGFLFSVIHVSSSDFVGLVIPFTFIGTLFAFLAGRTGSLWNSIAVHFLFNSIGLAANLASGSLT
jgi:membrane protease YdiL (CAAX protease family)